MILSKIKNFMERLKQYFTTIKDGGAEFWQADVLATVFELLGELFERHFGMIGEQDDVL